MKSIFSEDYKKLVSAIKRARVEQELTQKQLSEKLGRSQSYVSKVEQGQTRLDVIQLKELSQALKVDLSKFIG